MESSSYVTPYPRTTIFICEAVANKQDRVGLSDGLMNGEYGRWMVPGPVKEWQWGSNPKQLETMKLQQEGPTSTGSSASRLCCAVTVDERNYQDCGGFDWVTTDVGTMQSRSPPGMQTTWRSGAWLQDGDVRWTTGFRPFGMRWLLAREENIISCSALLLVVIYKVRLIYSAVMNGPCQEIVRRRNKKLNLGRCDLHYAMSTLPFLLLRRFCEQNDKLWYFTALIHRL